MTEFFAEQDEARGPAAGQGLGTDEPEEMPSAARTLGGAPVPSSDAPQQSSSSKRNKGPRKGVATLGDYASGGGRPADDSDDDDMNDQDLFAGGEKSGLAVQNPDDLKKKIIEKAQK